MAARAYQYETSPRKLEPEYEPNKKRKNSKSSKNTRTKTKTNVKSNNKVTKKTKKQMEKEKAKKARRSKFLVTLNCVLVLVGLFVVIWRNSLINQSFAQIQMLKKQISEVQKENDQLEISIQNNLNLNNIEQEAKEKLGMQKLTNKQTVYLNLPKKDYVEPSSESIVIEEKTGILQNVKDFLNRVF